MLLDLNDQCITLKGLLDQVTGSYVNDATVGVTLQKDGVDVSGEAWPLNMPYVSGTNGDYRAILLAAIDLTPGDNITVSVGVETPSGGVATFTQLLPVKERGFSG
jgi:hypothetical protein